MRVKMEVGVHQPVNHWCQRLLLRPPLALKLLQGTWWSTWWGTCWSALLQVRRLEIDVPPFDNTCRRPPPLLSRRSQTAGDNQHYHRPVEVRGER